MIRLLIILVLMSVAQVVTAEDDIITGTIDKPARPVTSTIMVGGGVASLTDNYLSPFKTNGWTTAIAFERIQASKFRPHNVSVWLAGNIDLGRTHNAQTTNGPMWRSVLHLEGAPIWRFSPWNAPVTIGIGPQLEIDGGIHYRPANSNNPVAAQVAVTISPSLHMLWRTHIGSLPLSVGYHGSLSMLGVFFAPEYGELYYEIYLGDRAGLAHFAWPGNRISYHHLLYADLHFGATSLRIGYDLRAMTQSANHLATNYLANTFMIGVTTTRLSINPGAARKTSTIVLGL